MVWDLGQHAQKGAGNDDGARVPQRRARLTLSLHLGPALLAQRQVVGCPQMRSHPEFTVYERRNGFDRQVLSGPELPRSDRRVALRGELRGQPGECTAEHVSRVDHHPTPLVWSRRNDGPKSNVARQPVADTREPQAVLAVSSEWLAR